MNNHFCSRVWIPETGWSGWKVHLDSEDSTSPLPGAGPPGSASLAWISVPWRPQCPLLVLQSPKDGPPWEPYCTQFLLLLALLISPDWIRTSICRALFRQTPTQFPSTHPSGPTATQVPAPDHSSESYFNNKGGTPPLNTPPLDSTPHVGSKCRWSVRLTLFRAEASVPLLWMKWISSRRLQNFSGPVKVL